MRRPGGFDGAAEPPRDEGPDARSSARDEEASDAISHGGPARTDAAEAQTVDLSEVRRARSRSAAPESRISALARRDRARGWQEPDPVRAAERELREASRRRRRHERREKRRFSAEARGRRRKWYVALGAVGALILFVAVGVLTPLMAVQEVRVEGTSLVNAEEVAETMQRFQGTPLALVDDGEVHRALEPFPLIQHYAIERIPPHTLLIRVEERVPVVALERDGAYGLYDAAGVLLSRSDAPPEGVPLGADTLNDLSSEAFLDTAAVLRDMPAALRAQVATASATNRQDITFTLTSGAEVLWGDAEQTQRKSVVLSSMLTALADQPVEHIDVSSTEAPVFR